MSDLSGVVLTRTGGADSEGMSIAEAVAACAGERLRQPTERPRCASPVLIEWMAAWADRLADGDRQQLGRYILPLTTSRATDDEEVARLWRVIDWLIRTDGPLWLRAARLPRHADALAAIHPVRYSQDFADAYPAVRDASDAARRAFEGVWLLVAQDARIAIVPAQPHHVGIVPVVDLGPHEPAKARRLETWVAVADATTSALQAVETLIDCATSAVGYRTATPSATPDSLRAITGAITNAAAAIAWSAIRALTLDPSWSWETTTADAASDAAAIAVVSALRPVEEVVRDAAHHLIRRML